MREELPTAGHVDGSQQTLGPAPDTDADRDWARLAIDQFLQGYADGDAIYDDYPTA